MRVRLSEVEPSGHQRRYETRRRGKAQETDGGPEACGVGLHDEAHGYSDDADDAKQLPKGEPHAPYYTTERLEVST